MKSMQSVCGLIGLLILPVTLTFAQTSGTATTPTSTTSTNRQQELYDQYHGYNKKNAAPIKTTNTSTSTTSSPPTPVQSTRSSTDNGNTQSTGMSSRPQQISLDGDRAGVRIGVRGGVTYPIFTEEQPLVKPNIGFVGGVTFTIGAGRVSFQPEVNYARYSVKGTNPFSGDKATGAFDQLEIPLLLKISSGNYNGNRFFVNVGPYGSYLTGISINGKKESIDGTTDRFHFGATAGLGAALKAGPGHATIEVRGLYQFGTTETGFSTDSKNILMQGTIGYSFPLGGR